MTKDEGITREEAIAVLQKIKPTPCRADGKSTTHTLVTIVLEMAIKALEQTRWIPCSERLPDIPDDKDWVRCLCYGEKEITPDHVDDPNTLTCIEIVTYFRRYGWDGWFHPIKWMLLPESCEAESEDKDIVGKKEE